MIPETATIAEGRRGPENKGIAGKNFAPALFLLELNTQSNIVKRGIAKLREYGDHWKNRANHIDDGRKAPPIEIVATSISVLSAAAAIKRILYVCRRPDNRAIVKRCNAMRKLIGNPEVPTIELLAVRNSWEHADERLDSLMKSRRPGGSMSISEIYVAADSPGKDLIALRRFDPIGFAIHYRDEVVSLDALANEAALIEERINHGFAVLRNEIVDLY